MHAVQLPLALVHSAVSVGECALAVAVNHALSKSKLAAVNRAVRQPELLGS